MNGIFYVVKIRKKKLCVNAGAAPSLLLVNIMLAAACRENAKNRPKICERRISSDNSVLIFHFFVTFQSNTDHPPFVSGQNGVSRADTPVVLGVNMD